MLEKKNAALIVELRLKKMSAARIVHQQSRMNVARIAEHHPKITHAARITVRRLKTIAKTTAVLEHLVHLPVLKAAARNLTPRYKVSCMGAVTGGA